MPAGLPVGTPRITTGNVRTTYDPYTPSPGATTPGATPPAFNGLACPLGSIYIDQGGPDSVSGTTTQLPVGSCAVYKYVLYKSTANPALVAYPAPVVYTDNTGLIVSGKTSSTSEAFPTVAAGMAGIMMLNTTDLSTVTATLLNNGGNGSGVWICIGGYVNKALAVASAAAGDSLLMSTTDFTFARNTAFAIGNFAPVIALTAIGSNAYIDVKVVGFPEI